jgi:hypothetical protein
MMLNKNFNKAENNLLQLDVSDLAQGVYYLKIKSDDAEYIQQVVKQ